MPGMNGIEATRQILAHSPSTRVIALSNHSGLALVQAILVAGGRGYVRKNRAFEELIPAIRTVCNGKRYVGENANRL
jgi:two-component system response regulator DegU